MYVKHVVPLVHGTHFPGTLVSEKYRFEMSKYYKGRISAVAWRFTLLEELLEAKLFYPLLPLLSLLLGLPFGMCLWMKSVVAASFVSCSKKWGSQIEPTIRPNFPLSLSACRGIETENWPGETRKKKTPPLPKTLC